MTPCARCRSYCPTVPRVQVHDLILPEDEKLGVVTVIDVWLLHMKFQTALHCTKYDDSIPLERKQYATAGAPSPPRPLALSPTLPPICSYGWLCGAAASDVGKEYVKAVLKASEMTATWQYLHYIYAHLYSPVT